MKHNTSTFLKLCIFLLVGCSNASPSGSPGEGIGGQIGSGASGSAGSSTLAGSGGSGSGGQGVTAVISSGGTAPIGVGGANLGGESSASSGGASGGLGGNSLGGKASGGGATGGSGTGGSTGGTVSGGSATGGKSGNATGGTSATGGASTGGTGGSSTPGFAPPLHVSGSQILDANNKVVQLEGFATNDAPSWQKKSFVENWKNKWKINVIRLAMHPDNWVNKSSTEQEAYLKKTDNLLQWTREVGIYVVLDGFHESGNTGTVVQHWENVKKAWRILAPRYKNQDHIIWEIYNEPYGYNAEGGGGDWTNWAPRADELIKIIMDQKPIVRAVVVASPNWDTEAYPRTKPLKHDQVILSWHPYTFTYNSVSDPNKDKVEGNERWTGSAARWEEKFGYVVTEGIAPVFAGEWNIRYITGVYFPDYGKALMDYCRDKGISHTYWAYAPRWGDGDLINEPEPEEVTDIGKWYLSYLQNRPKSPSAVFPLP